MMSVGDAPPFRPRTMIDCRSMAGLIAKRKPSYPDTAGNGTRYRARLASHRRTVPDDGSKHIDKQKTSDGNRFGTMISLSPDRLIVPIILAAIAGIGVATWAAAPNVLRDVGIDQRLDVTSAS